MKPRPICADNGPQIPGVGARGGGSPGVALGAAAANVQRHGQLLGVNPGHHSGALKSWHGVDLQALPCAREPSGTLDPANWECWQLTTPC